ncbi:MAG: rod-binding protein [Bdellovibrionales bacterium]|nr:rod-binding protein [Bdellovibrionales bacterium]
MEIKKSIPISPPPNQEKQMKQLRKAAQMYEQHFLGEMVKAMRGTVHKSGFIPESFGERVFQSHLDQEYVSSWTQRGGVGLSDLIFNQIKERYFPDPVAKLGIPQGPIPTNTPQGTLRIHQEPNGEGRAPVKIDIKGQSELPDEVRVTSPWSGKVLKVQYSPEGKNSVLIQHPEGLRSELSFSGPLSNLKEGDILQAGDNLGRVQGQDFDLKWNLWG